MSRDDELRAKAEEAPEGSGSLKERDSRTAWLRLAQGWLGLIRRSSIPTLNPYGPVPHNCEVVSPQFAHSPLNRSAPMVWRNSKRFAGIPRWELLPSYLPRPASVRQATTISRVADQHDVIKSRDPPRL